MKNFTPYQYLLIDVANQFGLDKERFEDRIAWAESRIETLEEEAHNKGEWKEKPMYLKAVSAVRKAQAGLPTGHTVGFDAVCSGMQIMSALMNCFKGAQATGLVDQDRRADAYTDCTRLMTEELGYELPAARKKVKNAVMTSLYGSKEEPKKEFGDDTPELNAFYKAMYKLCPGACDLLEMLLSSWNPGALTHEWILPDGFYARVKVMQLVETNIEIDELASHTFTYQYVINKGENKGVKNAANVIHSIDAYVLRSLVRRCSYDRERTEQLYSAFTAEVINRQLQKSKQLTDCPAEEVSYYIKHFERSGMADIVILPYLDQEMIRYLSDKHLAGLRKTVEIMLNHEPFDLITVHDDFKCHPNHMGQLREHYRQILADLADSKMLDDILSQLHGYEDTVTRRDPGLAKIIRQSNYALT